MKANVCSNCGGNLKKVSNINYWCDYCGSHYEKEEKFNRVETKIEKQTNITGNNNHFGDINIFAPIEDPTSNEPYDYYKNDSDSKNSITSYWLVAPFIVFGIMIIFMIFANCIQKCQKGYVEPSIYNNFGEKNIVRNISGFDFNEVKENALDI